MPGKITLTVVAGRKQGELFVFDQHDTLLFGRMDDCQISLPDDQQVSRYHFILEANPPVARLRDLGSRNGTFVNGQKYGGREKHETPDEGARRQYPYVDLHDGDEIRVGQTILRVGVEAVADSQEAVCCQHCGRDVSAEVGPGRHGSYVCNTCRQQMQVDPAKLLQSLRQQARERTQFEDNYHIPDYQIVQKLGQGGMGAVYLVRHTSHGHQAALKTMLPEVVVDAKQRKIFLREIAVTRSLQHENIVKFLNNGADGAIFYFLLEYCEGGSLSDLMQHRGGRLSLEEAGPLLLQAMEGLAFAHTNKIVHRDLKPQNILLSRGEVGWVAKIGDMGLAKNFELAGFSTTTRTGPNDIGGTCAYMPYEQAINFRYVEPVSDVWSMGAICYFVLTGRYPRSHQSNPHTLTAVMYGDIIPIRRCHPTLPHAVAEVIDRALAKYERDRYQDAGELREAFAKALEEARRKQ